MLNKSLIFLFALICSISVVVAEDTIKMSAPARIDSLWFCFTIKTSKLDLKVHSSGLDKGYWIKSKLEVDEVPAPDEKHALPNQPLTICSSGLEDTPYGTEGYIWLSRNKNKEIKLSWAFNYAGPVNYSLEYNENVFRITKKTVEDQFIEIGISALT